MISKIAKYAVLLAAAAVLFACAPSSTGSSRESSESGSAVDALQNARVLERLAEGMPTAKSGGTAPGFVLDPAWPKPLPNKWIIGDIGGVDVDHQDHIWVYHRPRMLSSTDSGMQGAAGQDAKGNPVSALGFRRPNGPLSGCCTPAPSVLEFDKDGNLVQAWGGPADPGFLENNCRVSDGCTWPAREHGIYVDHNDFVYVSGNGQAVNFHGQFPWAPNFGDDSHILKFTRDGKFVMQIGAAGGTGPKSNDTNGGINGTPQPFLVADMMVNSKTNLLYVADGYGNRRVLIVNAETGKYVGHFGAYGQNPVLGENKGDDGEGPSIGAGSWSEDYKNGQMNPKFFRTPVHCVVLADDGKLYVCDRGNNRVQVFNAAEVGKPCANPEGEVGKCGFIGEVHVAPQTGAGTSTTVSLSTDENQSCLYIADLTNYNIYVLNRENLQELSRFATGGRQAGELHWPHAVSVDAEGNIYVGEVDGAARVQKYLRYGPSGCSGTGAAEVGKYASN